MGIGAAVVGSAVVGAAASSSAASKQSSSANRAADMQQQAAQDAAGRLQPYSMLGQQAINPLWAALGYQATPDQNAINRAQAELDQYVRVAPTMGWDPAAVAQRTAELQQDLADAQSGAGQYSANPNSILQQQFQFNPQDLENTPGYQFARQQGLKSVQNQMSSQGLGLSGAQIKGATDFATGLADQTYGNQYNRALSTFNTNYQSAANNANRLQQLVGMGQNAAGNQAQATIGGAQGAGNYLTQAGNAQASGIMGVGNAAQNGAQNYMMYNALYPSK